MFKKILQFFSRPRTRYHALVQVTVARAALLHNLHTFQRQFPNLQFAPVLKSNAYGHGLALVAKIIDNEKIAFLIVDSFFEALVLRRAGIKSKILILGYATAEQICHSPPLRRCAFTIISLESLQKLAASIKYPTEFHIKIDTGFNRQGILPSEITTAIQLIKSNPKICLTGICSHLADASNANTSYSKQQIIIWEQAVKIFQKSFSTISAVHLSASASAYLATETQGAICRLGLGLYGFDLSPSGNLSLRPALELRSLVSGVKHIPAGTKIGYDVTYTASRAMAIATVPAGYNEGVDRRLSNQGFFMVNGVASPIVGRVSMNISTIDVSGISRVQLETPVIIISRNPADPNSVSAIAKQCGTIPYEILTHISPYLRRVEI